MMTDDRRGFARVPDAMCMDRSDVLSVRASQLPQDVLLQPPLCSLGQDLRVSRVRRGPHNVTTIRQGRSRTAANGDNRTEH